MAKLLLERLPASSTLVLTSRFPKKSLDLVNLASGDSRVKLYPLDVTSADSIEEFAATLRREVPELHCSIYSAALLHDDKMQPEKRVEQLDAATLSRAFSVNASGAALIAQAVIPLMRHKKRAVIANLSARVGSISDNRSGGWYAYRASKAAQNMLTKTLSIELKRRMPNVICVGLHPGTVDTALSRPFQAGVPKEKLFSASRAARQLLDIIDSLEPNETGLFFDWKRDVVEW